MAPERSQDDLAGYRGHGMNYFRCNDCGRFISYDELDSHEARHRLVTPDSAYTNEEFETVCKKCLVRENEEANHF